MLKSYWWGGVVAYVTLDMGLRIVITKRLTTSEELVKLTFSTRR